MSLAARLRKLKHANYRETEPILMPDGSQWVLSTLTGDEDRDMADYLREYTDRSFGHYVKLETLAYAIKWIQPAGEDPINLRNTPYIETGDTNANGVPIKVKRHVFLRDIVNSQVDVVVDALFTKWSQLVESVEKGVNKTAAIELGDAGLAMKIDTVEAELRSLVLDAERRGIPLNADLTRHFSLRPMGQDGGDMLLQALKTRQQEEPEPRPVHPVDEQLEREKAASPDIYRGGPAQQVEETPQPIRR